MYIAFDLRHPLGSRPMSRISEALDQWCERYQVNGCKTKLQRHYLRVTFDDDSLYALFALTWMPGNQDPVFAFSMIEPMKKQ